MSHYATCGFDVELKEGVTIDQIKAIADESFGEDECFVQQGGGMIDRHLYIQVEGSTLTFYLGAAVTWEFEGSFDKFCGLLTKFADGAFRTDLEEDSGPSAAGSTTTTYWAEHEADRNALEIRDKLSSLTDQAKSLGELFSAKMDEPVVDRANAPGLTILAVEEADSMAEPLVSVDLCYVSDPAVREFIIKQAQLLAAVIAQSKGDGVQLSHIQRSLMPMVHEKSSGHDRPKGG